MTEVSWDLFRVKNSNHTKSFEALCKSLFARKISIKTSELTEYHNQKGIEVEPVLYKKKLISFQSKFSDADDVLWPNFEESLKKTIEELKTGYTGLKEIFYYSNGTASKTNKTRERIEKKAKQKGLKIIWVYSKQIIDLIEDVDNSDLRKKYFGGGKNLDIFLPDLKNKPKKNISALKYQSRLTSFTGREFEIVKLKKFVKDLSLIQWWVIEGKGGVGKSRLALEFCLELEKKGWHCGFFSSYEEHGFDSWDPEKPHLIICDYVLGKEKEIAKAIKKVISMEKSKMLHFQIRFLLLERSGSNEIQEINSIETFGPIIQDHLYRNQSLALKGLDDISLEKTIKEVAEFFELSNLDYKNILDKIKERSATKNFIYGGLLCLFKYYKISKTIDYSFEAVIKSLLDRERKFWLDKLDFSEEKESYLILASLLGGIDTLDKNKHSSELSEYLVKVDLKDSYSLIVGVDTNTFLSPLSHDLINELYVLDGLSDRNKFNKVIQLGLGYKNGEDLLSFFTRAAYDYKKHPSLNYLMLPFGQFGHKSLIWLLIISNVIDKIDIDIYKKIELLNKLNHDLINHASNSIKTHLPIFDNIFIRILNEITKVDALKKWIREYKILEPKKENIQLIKDDSGTNTMQSSQQVSTLENLKPQDYCSDILESYRVIDDEIKEKFFSMQLFEAYYHYSIHLLATRQAGFIEIRELLEEMRNVFSNNFPQILNRVYRDVIVGLYQWGYINKDSKLSSEITLNLLSIMEGETKNNETARCYSAASTLIANTLRDYESKKNILNRFKKSFIGFEKDKFLSTQFIAISVSLMYYFESQADFNYGFKVIKKAQFLTSAFPSQENTVNLSLAIAQLVSYNGKYIKKQEKNYIINNCISTAKKYGIENIEIITNIVGRLSTEYSNAITSKRDNHKELFDKVLNLVKHFKTHNFEKSIHLGNFLMSYFNYSLDTKNLKDLMKLADIICELNTIDYVDLNHIWSHMQNDFFSKYQAAKNTSKPIIMYKKTAEYWLEKECAVPMEAILKHIIND